MLMDVELAFNFLDVLFESNVSEKCCSVLMACGHANEEPCPHSNILGYQSGSPSLRATASNPQLQRTKSCTVCHSATAGCFLFHVPPASKNQWSKAEHITPPAQIPLLPVLPISVNATTICPDAQVRNLEVLFDLSHKLHPTNLLFC